MYQITITTKYNTIVLNVEDYNTPQVQEILEQPYIIQVKIEKVDKAKVKVLKNEQKKPMV